MLKSVGILLIGALAFASVLQTVSAAPTAQASKPPRDLMESGPAPRVSYVGAPRPEAFELFRGSRMFLRGTINGNETGMMLDSGASMTVLDTAYAKKIGVKGDRHAPIAGASGSIPGEIASNVSVGVGGLMMDGSDVIIMDLSPIAKAIGRPIPVILGHDALDSGPVTIDFQYLLMLFVPGAGFRAPTEATKVELGHDGPFRSVKVAVAGLPPINATFDIGNGGTVLLAKSYWDGLRSRRCTEPRRSLAGSADEAGAQGHLAHGRVRWTEAQSGSRFPEPGPGRPTDRRRQPWDRDAEAVRGHARLCQ